MSLNEYPNRFHAGFRKVFHPGAFKTADPNVPRRMIMAFGFGATTIRLAARPAVLKETCSEKSGAIEQLPELGDSPSLLGYLGRFCQTEGFYHSDTI